MEDTLSNTVRRPLLPLRGMIVFPGMLVNLDVGRERSVRAVEQASKGDHKIFLVTQKDAAVVDVQPEDLYACGVLADVRQLMKLPNGTVRILVEGLERVRLLSVEAPENKQEALTAEGETVAISIAGELEIEALRRMIVENFERWVLITKKIDADMLQALKNHADPGRITDMIASYLDIAIEEKQRLLETFELQARMRLLYEQLLRELEIAGLEKNIALQVRSQIETNQKEYYLREQLKAINKELGEGDELNSEIEEYKKRMQGLQLPQEVTAKIEKELERLQKMPPMMAESAVIRNYLDALLELPWGKFTEDKLDLKSAAKILKRGHYGLKNVKVRILEYLAERALTKNSKGPILCLVGPPGVGKTSLAHSVAEAIGRQFIRVSLGGIRDEAEIRGHRRTYIGAMPGRIIHGMQACGCMNPVFLLDEIDKMSADFRGSPASALLEALDPEQNSGFSDHYIEFPFDLSNVFWLVTANTVDSIPPALLDRMEIITLSSYTEDEKVKIAQRHLLPRERRQHGLKANLAMGEAVLRRIIRDYTREAGVRNLERKIAAICRKTAHKLVTKGVQSHVTDKNLEKYLGPPVFLEDGIDLAAEVGSCTGLAWTSVGGELLKVEALACRGKGNLTLTGQLGDVMKESAQAGYTYIRSRAAEQQMKEDFFETADIHIHLPE